MPYCAILECHNNTTEKNLKNGGVSYFKFPKDPHIKEQWIDATGRIDWMPTKNSTICSEHFKEEDFKISKKGYKYIKDHGIPTLKILKFFDELKSSNDASLKRKVNSLTSSESDCTNLTQPKKEYESGISEQEQSLHLQIATLEGKLRFCEEKVKKQNSKIKRLQRQNQRLITKINKGNSIEEILYFTV